MCACLTHAHILRVLCSRASEPSDRLRTKAFRALSKPLCVPTHLPLAVRIYGHSFPCHKRLNTFHPPQEDLPHAHGVAVSQDAFAPTAAASAYYVGDDQGQRAGAAWPTGLGAHTAQVSPVDRKKERRKKVEKEAWRGHGMGSQHQIETGLQITSTLSHTALEKLVEKKRNVKTQKLYVMPKGRLS